MIPLKIETLLEGRVVEHDRVEYKTGWNPNDIIHSICAFANDYDNSKGGYIVIGVKEENGMPVFPLAGVQKEELDSIQQEIFQYCNMIVPRYIPRMEIVNYKNSETYLIYLWCPAGDSGPYQAPQSVYSVKGGKIDKSLKYWIRPASLTTDAKQDEISELYDKFNSVPFDDRINRKARIDDIRRGYIEDFIRKSNSSLINELNNCTLEDLLIAQEVADETDTELDIRNIGVLMFTEHPEKLIPGAYIELIRFNTKDAEASDDFIEKTFTGPIWKQVMDQIHEGKEPLDWEQPATVEMTTDSKSGITDLFSATLHERAEQSLHDKEQRKLEEDLETAVTAFEDKTIETVEDTYWVKEQYQSIISKLNLMDGSDKRTELLERMTKRNEEFAPIISEMQDTITLYEAQKAKEKAEAQKKAEEDAITARKNQEIQTRKNTFLSALRDVENLEYQSSDAESLVQNAINKLSLVETYEEAASYKERLQKAIDRIATLPTESEWQAAKQAEEEAKAASQAADQQQIGLEQQSLRSYLNQAKRSWNTWTSQPSPAPEAGPGSAPGASSQPAPSAPTTGGNN